MKIFHPIINEPFLAYDKPVDAISSAKNVDNLLQTNLDFDLTNFFDKKMDSFLYGRNVLRLYFYDHTYFQIMLGNHGVIELSDSDNVPIAPLPDTEIDMDFGNSQIYHWKPENPLEYFRGKIFKKIHISENYIYLYFFESSHLLSVSSLHIEEFPFNLLFWHFSD